MYLKGNACLTKRRLSWKCNSLVFRKICISWQKNEIIDKKISDSFLKEAMNSPQLLEDMASMEKYLSESYGNRVFIELLQNADDCGSKKIIFIRDGGDLVFANNGRPFNENDIMSICRSGASSKKRGESIGFRGVGFKSTTYLSSEIIILSNNVSFSFSKSICAKALNKKVDKVPTARIPFLVDYTPSTNVSKILNDGFTTVFVFKNAKLNEFSSEFEEINDGYFLFLRNIESCVVNINKTHYECKLSRMPHKYGELVQNLKSKRNWLNISQEHVTLSFLYEDGIIQECQKSDALFHCYLPTFDNCPYPFKINYDFTTDPSRKHITYDTIFDSAISIAAKLIANILTKAFSGKDNLLFRNIFTLLDSPSSFTFINLALKTKFETEIQASVMLSLQNGDIIPISEYKIFPEWLEESEKHYIREHSNFVKEHTLPIEMFRQIVNLESFIAEYSNTEYSQEDWIKILEDEDFVDSLTNDTYSTILCNILEKYKVERAINGKKLNYSSIAIKTEQGIKTLRELSKDLDIMIDVDLKEKLSSSLSNNTISSFCEENRLEPQQILPINYVDNEDVDIDDEDEDSLSASNQNSSILTVTPQNW